MIESALAGACDVGSEPCDGALTESASADGGMPIRKPEA